MNQLQRDHKKWAMDVELKLRKWVTTKAEATLEECTPVLSHYERLKAETNDLSAWNTYKEERTKVYLAYNWKKDETPKKLVNAFLIHDFFNFFYP